MADLLLPPIIAAMKMDLANFITGAKQAEKQTDDTTKTIGGKFDNMKSAVASHWKSVVATVTGVISVAAVEKFATSAVDKFESVTKEVAAMQRLTGDSAENMSRLRAAAQMTGTSADALTGAVKKLSKSAFASGESLTGPFLDLGIQVQDTTGEMRPMNDILMDVATKFKDMPNGVDKNAEAMKLFGKSGTDLIPFLNKGAAGIAELEKQSDKLGQTIGQKDVDAVKKNTLAKREMNAAIEGLQIQVGRYLYPAFTALSMFMAENLPKAIALARQGFEMIKPKIDDVIAVAKTIFEYLDTHRGVLEAVGVVVGVVLVGAFLAYTVQAVAAAVATIAALAPFIAITAAVAALVAGVIYAYQHWGWFRAAVDAAKDGIMWFWEHAIQPFAEWISNDFVGKLEIAGRILLGVFTLGISEAVIAVKNHWDDIVAFIKDIPGKITSAADGMWDGLTGGAKGAANLVIDAVNAIIRAVDSFQIHESGVHQSILGKEVTIVPAFDWNGFNIAQLQHFKTGGMVQGPAGMPVLAVVHGGEKVLTADQQRTSGNVYQLTVNAGVGADGKLIGKQIIDEIVKAEKYLGSNWRQAS